MTRSRFTALQRGRRAAVGGRRSSPAGLLFGNIPWVKANLDKIIWAIILIPGLIAIFGAWKAGRERGRIGGV